MRILTLNVCGIRASQKKGLYTWLVRQKADVICLQEIRANEQQICEKKYHIKGFGRYLKSAEKKGYSGVSIYSKEDPLNINDEINDKIFDSEGRFIEVELPSLFVSSVYFPSGSSSDERQKLKYKFMEKFEIYLSKVKKREKPTVICGDWNIAHKKIDIKNWRSNQKNSGFLPQERKWLDNIMKNYAIKDAFREVNTKEDQYTWWSNRGRAWDNNVGWRIDYQMLVNYEKMRTINAKIYKQKRFSDHSPLIIDYEL